MLKYLKKYGYAVYMGIAFPALTNTDLTEWQYWAFIVPIVILVVLREDAKI